MTSLVQNQGKRKFILKEGEIAPMGTLEMDDKEAQKILEIRRKQINEK